MKRLVIWQIVVGLLLVVGNLSADWRQFRGPGGNGRSDEKNLPVKWSDTENVAWKLELPGLGTSSPIVVGNRVFVTCYSGYAESSAMPGEMKNLRRHVVCVDRNAGKIIWQAKVEPELPETEYKPKNDAKHGYSSSTPVSDGKHLFVFFGKTGVLCFDLDGKKLWQKSVGAGMHHWGSSNSPVLHNNVVIVNAALETGAMVALEKSNGEEKWRTKVPRQSWGSPILVPADAGKHELVISVPDTIFAVDPDTGKELWRTNGSADDYICPSAISHDGIIYVVGGRGGAGVAMAIRPGGRGELTDSHILWKKEKAGNRVASPVYDGGYLFWASDQGTLHCHDAKSGEQVFVDRISPEPGIIYASLVAADGKLYCISQENGVYVFAAKPKYELLSHNKIDDSRANASPAIDKGQILIRNDKYLYCIGKDARVAQAK